MHSFFTALSFLTTIPLPQHLAKNFNFSGCQRYFPLIGAIIGLLAAICCYIFFALFPGLVAAVLSTIFLLVLTGGLHMDGLSDTADGFLSQRPREKILQIMKDSCIGSFGSLAQVCILLLKISALYALADQAYVAIFITPIIGRSAILLLSNTFSPASTNGLGHAINSSNNTFPMLLGLVVGGILLIVFFSYIGLLALILALATILILGKISQHKIGGYTGDILGAGCELSETVTLIILCSTKL